MSEKIRNLFTPLNFFVFSFLLVAFFLRVYRINELLGFHYDQGRDALVIWDLIKNGKFFLIGPTTGLEGVFRGPFYYYLIAPFYWLGNGNPLWPEVFLISSSVVALLVMYILAKDVGGVPAGLATLILGTFSYEVIYASRWLSNPTPMLLLSVLFVWTLLKIWNGNKKLWPLATFFLGLSFFHFGSSGELFYFPAIFVFTILLIKHKNSLVSTGLSWKNMILSLFTFLFSAAPLLIFDLKHDGILSNKIQSTLSGQGSFGFLGTEFILDRFILILNYFGGLLFHDDLGTNRRWIILLIFAALYSLPQLFRDKNFRILLLMLASPLFGLLFFTGNYGNVYSYYLTGYYLIFLIFTGTILGNVFSRSLIGKLFVMSFLTVFLYGNWFWVREMSKTKVLDQTTITLGTQKLAIDWIFQEAGERDFNVDVYVPPVIPYSYDYLFKWYRPTGSGSNPKLVDEQVPLLFTLFEIDPEHPDRLKAWLDRQEDIGKVTKEERFGGIVIQERTRLP